MSRANIGSHDSHIRSLRFAEEFRIETHCIVAASLAAVVEGVLGTDVPEISTTSPTAPGVTHRWTNVQAFVNEVSEARIWAGFHYRFSTKVGHDMGYRIGGHVVNNFLQPVTLATR